MGSIHMWVVLTDLPITAAKSAARIQTGWWMLFYFILLFWAIWLIVRCVKGLKALDQQQPPANVAGWLF